MKKKLLLVFMFFSQYIVSSQAALSSANKVILNSKTSNTLDQKDSNVLEDNHHEDFMLLRVLNEIYSSRPSKRDDIDLKNLFEDDLEEFFASIDFASQDSLIVFSLEILNNEITFTKESVKKEVIKMILSELDFIPREFIYSWDNEQSQKNVKNLLEKTLKDKSFNKNKYIEKSLIQRFSNYFKNKNAEAVKKEILSLNIHGINLSDDLSVILKKIFETKYSRYLYRVKNSIPDKVVKKIIDKSFLSISTLSKNQLQTFLTLFIKNNCFYGIEKIIDSAKFKEFSSQDITNILIFVIEEYMSDNKPIYCKIQSYLGHTTILDDCNKEINKNENNEAYNKIILKLFNINNKSKEILNLFLTNCDALLEESNKRAFFTLWVLAKDIDKNYISILIEASKNYKDKNFLYERIDLIDLIDLRDVFYDDGKTFFSILVLNGFFNDSKKYLIKLLDVSSVVYNKPLVGAILYQAFSNFSNDFNFVNEIREKIEEIIDDAFRRYKMSEFITIGLPNSLEIIQKQQNFINELKALNSLKDNVSSLSYLKNVFYNAYLEYLKGNKQDLRNLVFPIGKNIYALAPEKESETQAVYLIIDSLNKLFKQDRIKFLLLDLVETNYQKDKALELLSFMDLRNQSQNSLVAKSNV